MRATIAPTEHSVAFTVSGDELSYASSHPRTSALMALLYRRRPHLFGAVSRLYNANDALPRGSPRGRILADRR